MTLTGMGMTLDLVETVEGTSNDVDIPPHPKWIEHPNLIENWIGNLCTQGNSICDEEESQSTW